MCLDATPWNAFLDTSVPGCGERGVAILGMLVDCNLFLPTDVVVRRQACECEFYFFGREKVVARMLGPFPFPLGSFDVDFGGGFR